MTMSWMAPSLQLRRQYRMRGDDTRVAASTYLHERNGGQVKEVELAAAMVVVVACVVVVVLGRVTGLA